MQHFPLCKAISREVLQKELEFCQEKLGAMLPRFQDCFPAANTEELVNGTDPEHPAYWGPVAGCDQKIVEMAAIATTLMLCGGRLAPCFPSHRREYRITTDRPISAPSSAPRRPSPEC